MVTQYGLGTKPRIEILWASLSFEVTQPKTQTFSMQDPSWTRLHGVLQTAASCKEKGAPAVDVHGVDLSESSQVRKFADDVLGKYKNVDVLVNNAGMGPSSGGGPVKGKGTIVQNCTRFTCPLFLPFSVSRYACMGPP